MAGRLAALIRSKYPGAYDDMDDATLERTVLAKYPEYADLAKEDVAGPSSTAVPSSAEATALGYMRSRPQGFSDEKPPSEPDTYWGGFRKGLSDYATELGSGMFQSAAHPQTASDVLGLVAPTMKASLLPHAARMPAGEGIKYTGRLVSEVPGDVTGAVSQ